MTLSNLKGSAMPHRSIDPRSGLVFDIHELGRRAGAMKEVKRQSPAPDGIGNDVIGVPAGSPIQLDVQLEAVVEGVLATGVAEVQLAGECARCLTAIDDQSEIDIQELFLFPGKEPDDDEASRVEGDLIDLEPVLRDTVVLDLPFIPLCREDCAGLCPVCGANLNAEPDHRHDEAIDPRWASLTGWQAETES